MLRRLRGNFDGDQSMAVHLPISNAASVVASTNLMLSSQQYFEPCKRSTDYLYAFSGYVFLGFIIWTKRTVFL